MLGAYSKQYINLLMNKITCSITFTEYFYVLRSLPDAGNPKLNKGHKPPHSLWFRVKQEKLGI